jgi:hypothetical protein
MTFPKCITLVGIFVVISVSAYADGIISGGSSLSSHSQSIQSAMIANRAPTRVDSPEFDSSLSTISKNVGPLGLRSESALPADISHEHQEQTAALLPEPNTGVTLSIGLLFLILIQRMIACKRKIRSIQSLG